MGNTKFSAQLEGYITPSEAAKLTGVSIQTIYTWIRRKHLAALRTGPKSLLARRVSNRKIYVRAADVVGLCTPESSD